MCPGPKHDLNGSRKGTDLVASGLLPTYLSSAPHCFLLASLTPALDLAVLGTAWVTDETENSLDVEWENPPTEVDYYKLQYGPLTGQEVAEVTVPKSNDPKSRYDITGKSQHWGCGKFAVDAEVGTVCIEGPGALGVA